MRLILFLLLPLFLISSCTGNSEERVYTNNVKIVTSTKWKYDADAIREAAKSTLKTNQDEDLMNGALSRLQNAAFIFNEDGSMMLDAPQKQYLGTWELTKDSKEFFILLEGTSSIGNTVSKITKDRIVLAADYEKGSIFPKIFIPTE